MLNAATGELKTCWTKPDYGIWLWVFNHRPWSEEGPESRHLRFPYVLRFAPDEVTTAEEYTNTGEEVR